MFILEFLQVKFSKNIISLLKMTPFASLFPLMQELLIYVKMMKIFAKNGLML